MEVRCASAVDRPAADRETDVRACGLGIGRQTLYRHIGAIGELWADSKRLIMTGKSADVQSCGSLKQGMSTAALQADGKQVRCKLGIGESQGSVSPAISRSASSSDRSSAQQWQAGAVSRCGISRG
jgi:hypothetical protein